MSAVQYARLKAQDELRLFPFGGNVFRVTQDPMVMSSAYADHLSRPYAQALRPEYENLIYQTESVGDGFFDRSFAVNPAQAQLAYQKLHWYTYHNNRQGYQN